MNELTKSANEIEYKSNGENINLTFEDVKQFLVSGNGKISDKEATMFLNLCKYQHLNPFLHEAYLIKFGTNPAQIVVSKEAFMKRAESNPKYDGVSAGLIVLRQISGNAELKYTKGAFKLPSDQIMGAWAEVRRTDRSQPHHIEISIQEFSKGQSTWKSMPATMIRKTAIVNALREAFPETLGGMYTEDDKNPNEPAESVQTEKTEKTQKLAERFYKPNKLEQDKLSQKDVKTPEKTQEPAKNVIIEHEDEEMEKHEPEQHSIFEATNAR